MKNCLHHILRRNIFYFSNNVVGAYRNMQQKKVKINNVKQLGFVDEQNNLAP